MGENSKQLDQWRMQDASSAVQEARDSLDRDINALQTKVEALQAKVRNTFDWHFQFQERPLVLIGIAFGAGALLSMVRSRSRR